MLTGVRQRFPVAGLALRLGGRRGLWLLLAFVFAAGFYLFTQQAHAPDQGPYASDLASHIQLAMAYAKGEVAIPHPGLHLVIIALSWIPGLPFAQAGALAVAILATLNCLAIYMVLSVQLGSQFSGRALALFCLSMLLVSAIYLRSFNQRLYIGQGTPNIWHNPTVIAVKPFALASFLLAGLFLAHPASWRLATATAASLLISVLMKPNFALAFLPGLALLLVVTRTREWRIYARTLLIALPALALLAYQYLSTYTASELPGLGPSQVDINFLSVWKLFSPNPLISLMLALAFPILVTLVDWRQSRHDHFLVLAWLVTVVGVLQFAFLEETGSRFWSGNWGWGYYIALQVLFVMSMVTFATRWRAHQGKSTYYRVMLALASTAFVLHLLSGLLYTFQIWRGGGYA